MNARDADVERLIRQRAEAVVELHDELLARPALSAVQRDGVAGHDGEAGAAGELALEGRQRADAVLVAVVRVAVADHDGRLLVAVDVDDGDHHVRDVGLLDRDDLAGLCELDAGVDEVALRRYGELPRQDELLHDALGAVGDAARVDGDVGGDAAARSGDEEVVGDRVAFGRDDRADAGDLLGRDARNRNDALADVDGVLLDPPQVDGVGLNVPRRGEDRALVIDCVRLADLLDL